MPIFTSHITVMGVWRIHMEIKRQQHIPAAAFQSLGFIKHHIMPVNTREIFTVLYDELVTCDDYVK